MKAGSRDPYTYFLPIVLLSAIDSYCPAAGRPTLEMLLNETMKLFLYFLFLAASSLIINSGLAIEGRAPSVASQFPNGALHNRQEWVPLQADDFTSGRPFPPTSASWKDPSAEIFVTITDYRDRLCGQTLYELYSKAEYPERVYVGLVQQSKPDDTDCIVSYCSLMGVKGTSRSSCPHIHQIRAMLMSIQEARGVAIAFLIYLLYFT